MVGWAKLKKTDMSDVWVAFALELKSKCDEQKLDFFEVRDWIFDSIGHFEKETFEYYVNSGATPEESTQKIDINILKGRKLYSFFVSTGEKRFLIVPIKRFELYSEEILSGFLKCEFLIASDVTFFIFTSIANSAKLRIFTNKIRDLAWG